MQEQKKTTLFHNILQAAEKFLSNFTHVILVNLCDLKPNNTAAEKEICLLLSVIKLFLLNWISK